MPLMRSILLWGSKNQWLRNNVPRMGFVQRALKRFMPGENMEDALSAAGVFHNENIPAVFTYLGENITNLSEAGQVTAHYLSLIDKIGEKNLDIEVSLKLTQLGLDLSFEKSLENFKTITKSALEKDNVVWIDMEASNYVDTTIRFYKKAKEEYTNTGLCLQAYLYRTEKDIEDLLKLSPCIRLVKGAYKEPADVAFKEKREVDENYLKLSKMLLQSVKNSSARAAFGTHDISLVKAIEEEGKGLNIPKDKIEFQMLYGIKTNEQKRLAGEGYNLRVLISYGEAWFPWYMRRLAERPANVGFVLKNLFTN